MELPSPDSLDAYLDRRIAKLTSDLTLRVRRRVHVEVHRVITHIHRKIYCQGLAICRLPHPGGRIAYEVAANRSTVRLKTAPDGETETTPVPAASEVTSCVC